MREEIPTFSQAFLILPGGPYPGPPFLLAWILSTIPFMPFKLWKPALRCDRCKGFRPVDALKAWVMQPVGPTTGRGDGGRTHYVCRACRALIDQSPN